jgi:hypothetical protein
MDYLEGQIEIEKAQVLYWNAMIVSGAYKYRALFHGTGETAKKFTGKELLEDATRNMKNHVRRLQSLIDTIPIGLEGEGPAG